MLICDLNNSAAVSDELLSGHVSLGVIGLPANDFKVINWLGRDVINGRQHRHIPLVSSTLLLTSLIAVGAQQLWIQLGAVVGIKTIAAMKCLMDGLYRFFDAVFATTPFVAPCDCLGFLAKQIAVVLIALPNLGRSTPTHANTSHPLLPR